MKKAFTLLVAALLTLTAGATDYQDSLYVDVYGSTVADTATVSVDLADDGTYTVALRNFKFSGMGVGNIVVDSVTGTADADGTVILAANKSIQIGAGDDPTVDSWLGPLLGDVPVVIAGKMNGGQLYLTIDINMDFGGMPLTVGVTFGHDFSPVVLPEKAYQDSLYVDVYGSTVADTATVYVRQTADNLYTVSLRNFKFAGMGVGNIVVDSVAATTLNDSTVALAANKSIQIGAGDDPTVDSWLGPLLGDVPVVVSGKMSDNHLYLTIDINMDFGGTPLTVGVTFGHDDTVDAIHGVTTRPRSAAGIYTLGGVRVGSMQPGQTYILRKADGSAVKVLR